MILWYPEVFAILRTFGIRLSTPEVLFDIIYSNRYYCRFNLAPFRVKLMKCKRSFDVAPNLKQVFLFLSSLLKLDLMLQLKMAMISLKSTVIGAIQTLAS